MTAICMALFGIVCFVAGVWTGSFLASCSLKQMCDKAGIDLAPIMRGKQWELYT